MGFKLNIKQEPKKEKAPAKRNDILWGARKEAKGAFTLKAQKSAIKIQEENKKSDKIQIGKKVSEIKNLADNFKSDNLKDIILDPEQQYAVDNLPYQKFACMIGQAGVGKTTTVRQLIEALTATLPKIIVNDQEALPAIAFCAFMGKAVHQLRLALDEQYRPLATTIHSLLGFKPVTWEDLDDEGMPIMRRTFEPTYTRHNKLPHKLIILDEAGSCKISLFIQLLNALEDDCRIIALGDLNQLVPVGGHSMLGYALLKWPTYELKTLHRNAGPIAIQADRVIRGLKPKTTPCKTVVVKELSEVTMKARNEILQMLMYLNKNNMFNSHTDALVVPQNIGPIGQEELNSVLVNEFNPGVTRSVIKAGRDTKYFGIGDKVLLTENQAGTDLTNGMIGIITDITLNTAFTGTHNSALESLQAAEHIDIEALENALESFEIKDDEPEEDLPEKERASSHVVTIQFQGKEEETTFSRVGEMAALQLGYAFTGHKAQGTTIPVTVVVVHDENKKLLCREWLYTAMTRASSKLIILHDKDGLRRAIRNQRIKGVTMEQKAKKFIGLTKSEFESTGTKVLDSIPDPIEFGKAKIKLKIGGLNK
jgi:exodeoxyribonuclease V alpha subunit